MYMLFDVNNGILYVPIQLIAVHDYSRHRHTSVTVKPPTQLPQSVLKWVTHVMHISVQVQNTHPNKPTKVPKLFCLLPHWERATEHDLLPQLLQIPPVNNTQT